MSQAHHTTAEAVNDTLTGDAAMQSRRERIIAGRMLLGLVLAVVIVALLTITFGLPALNLSALAATVAVLGLLIAYAAGF